MSLDMKFMINFSASIVIFTLSFYHLALFLGRFHLKKEWYNLYFSLIGLSIVLTIYSFIFLKPGIVNIFFINLFISFFIFFIIKALDQILFYSFIGKVINKIIYFFLFLNLLITIPILWKGRQWFYNTAFIPGIIIGILFTILLFLNIIRTVIKNKYWKDFVVRYIILGFCFLCIDGIMNQVGQLHINPYLDFFSENFIFYCLFYLFFAYALSVKSNLEFKQLLDLRISLEQKVQDRTAELEQEKENKTRFFTNAAHETKTPLTLIKNYLDEVIKKNNLGRDRDMRVVRDNVLKLETDMLNFLDSEKIERGEMVYRHDQVIDFSQFTRDKIALFKPVFEKKALHFQSQVRDRIYLKASSQSLDRVLNNLFDNAVKYTPQNGKIYAKLKLNGRLIQLTVTNSGPVLCDTEIKDIFNPYYQANREKSNAQGMGLGLYIVKNIVQSLEGQIEVQSSFEEGTTVSIKLMSYTLKDNDVLSSYQLEQPRDAKVPDLKNRPENHYHRNILLVEDDLHLLEILYRHLKEDYNVFCAVNGKDALQLMKEVRIDLIVSDIMMDVMDGYELLHKVPCYQQHIPFLFITARTTEQAKTAGLNQGAIDFIYKPFTMAELKLKIKNHIHNRVRVFNRTAKNMIHKIEHHGQMNREDEFEMLAGRYELTETEKKIVLLLGKGYDNKDVARKINRATRTVHNHTQNIFRKLGVRTRVELLKKMKFFH